MSLQCPRRRGAFLSGIGCRRGGLNGRVGQDKNGTGERDALARAGDIPGAASLSAGTLAASPMTREGFLPKGVEQGGQLVGVLMTTDTLDWRFPPCESPIRSSAWHARN